MRRRISARLRGERGHLPNATRSWYSASVRRSDYVSRDEFRIVLLHGSAAAPPPHPLMGARCLSGAAHALYGFSNPTPDFTNSHRSPCFVRPPVRVGSRRLSIRGEEGVYEAGTERAGGRSRYFYLSSDVRDAEFADDDGGRS